MYTMNYAHTHTSASPLNSFQVYPTPHSPNFMPYVFSNLLSPACAVRILLGVGPHADACLSYQGPHPSSLKKTDSHSLSSYQVPIVPQS